MAAEATPAEVEETKMRGVDAPKDLSPPSRGESNVVGEGEDFSVGAVGGEEGGPVTDCSSYVLASRDNGDLGSEFCEHGAGGGAATIMDQNEGAVDVQSDPQREDGAVKVSEFGSVEVRGVEIITTPHVVEKSQLLQNNIRNAVVQPDDLNQSSKPQEKLSGGREIDFAKDVEKDNGETQAVPGENGHVDATSVVANGDVLVDQVPEDPMTIDEDGQVDLSSDKQEAGSVPDVEKDNQEGQSVGSENDGQVNLDRESILMANGDDQVNHRQEASITIDEDSHAELNVEKKEAQSVNDVENYGQEDQAVVIENADDQVILDKETYLLAKGLDQVYQEQEASMTIDEDSHVKLSVENKEAESSNDVEKDNLENQAMIISDIDDPANLDKETNLLANQGQEVSLTIDEDSKGDLNVENKETNSTIYLNEDSHVELNVESKEAESANDVEKVNLENQATISDIDDQANLDKETNLLANQGQEASMTIDEDSKGDSNVENKETNSTIDLNEDSRVELNVENKEAESANDVEKDNPGNQATISDIDDQANLDKETDFLANQGQEASMTIDEDSKGDLNVGDKEANSTNDVEKDNLEDRIVVSENGGRFKLDQEANFVANRDGLVDLGQEASLAIDGSIQVLLNVENKEAKSEIDAEDKQEDLNMVGLNGVQAKIDQETNITANGDILFNQVQKAPMTIDEDGNGDLILESKEAESANNVEEDNMKSQTVVGENAQVYLDLQSNFTANDEDYEVDLNLGKEEADYAKDVESNPKETQALVSEIDQAYVDQEPTFMANGDVQVYQCQEALVTIVDDGRVDLNVIVENREAECVNEAPVDCTPSETVMNFAPNSEMASCHSNTLESESEFPNGLVSPESRDTLSADCRGDLDSETVICNDSVDGIQNTTRAGLDGLSENAESLHLVVHCTGSEAEDENTPDGANLHADHNNNVVAKDGGEASSMSNNFPGCAENGDNFHADLNNNIVGNVDEEASLVNHNFPGCAESMENETVDDCPAGNDSFSNPVASAVRCGIVFGSMDCEEQLPAFQFGEARGLKVSNGSTGCASGQLPSLTGNLKLESESAFASRSRAIFAADATVSEPVVVVDSDVNSEKPSNSVLDLEIENDNDDKLICPEAENVGELHKDETSISSTNALDAEGVKKPFFYLIRIPRLDIDSIREKIKDAQLQVDKKTQYRDAIRAEIQQKRAASMELSDKFEAAKSEERAVRESLKSKRQEIDSVQYVINKVKNAISVDDIDGKIHNMEHRIEHESLPLAEEKYYLREIKQLKSLREQFSSNVGKQDELKQALDQREQTEERLKSLKKELESLKDKVSRVEGITKAAKKSYFDEKEKVSELQAQFRAANDIRQEAFADLQKLRKQLYEKHKYMRMYKDSAEAASKYVSDKNTDELQRLCLDQVNKTMDLWNNNDEFRKEYVKCNIRSTAWRLKTLDGRSLGPDEDPPVLVNNVSERVHNPVSIPAKASSSLCAVAEEKQLVRVEADKADDKSVEQVLKPVINEVKAINNVSKTKKSTKHDVLMNGSVSISARNVTEETEEELKPSKEELEMARKAEELRKEEVAAKLKEQRKLEEKVKAKEAQERKKRNAERARAKAELRAQKEAEEKEKERERRARKKERKKGGASEVAGGSNDGENAATVETPNELLKESESKESRTIMTKRPQKPLTKATSKTKSMPLPLRNRSKRKMQPWMWVLLTVLVVLALFVAGNSSLSYRSFLPSYGF